MVNQLGKFSEHLAGKTKSIRDLLRKGNQWTWGSERQKAFEEITFNLNSHKLQYWLCMVQTRKQEAADASSFGLGGATLQLQPDNSWRPVSFILRAIDDAL